MMVKVQRMIMYRESSENDGLKRHRACDEVEGQKGTLKGKRGGRVCLELRGHKRERTFIFWACNINSFFIF